MNWDGRTEPYAGPFAHLLALLIHFLVGKWMIRCLNIRLFWTNVNWFLSIVSPLCQAAGSCHIQNSVMSFIKLHEINCASWCIILLNISYAACHVWHVYIHNRCLSHIRPLFVPYLSILNGSIYINISASLFDIHIRPIFVFANGVLCLILRAPALWDKIRSFWDI